MSRRHSTGSGTRSASPRPRRLAAVFLVSSGMLASVASMAAGTLIVEAGAFDRTNVVVRFPWNRGNGAWRAEAEDGTVTRVQAHDNEGWIIEPGLGRGATRRYRLTPWLGSPLGEHAPSLHRGDGSHELRLGDKPVLRYRSSSGEFPRSGIPERYRRGGYLHPVWSPAGHAVTDDYPRNHVHHHGWWTAWTRTEFQGRQPDFWNMGEGKARVDFESIGDEVEGPVFVGFKSVQVFTDLLAQPPVVALKEDWTLRLFGLPAEGGHLFDLELEQRCATESPLVLPRYYYGGFGHRGRWEWNDPAQFRYLDSNGNTNRMTANETRVRWYWMGGEVEGGITGAVVFGHPASDRHPQPVRVHPREPFICWAPSQAGDWSIRPGEPFRARYRILVLDGMPDRGRVEQVWADYADPPTVRIE